MAISLKHNFQSAIADGGDTSLVQPSNWNAEHDLTLATSRLIGRTTAGTGAAEEISVGTGLSLSAGSLAVGATTPQTDTTNTFTASQIISVTDNTNAALRITQLGTGEAIRVEDSTNPDSTAFVVDASGAVTTGGGITANGSISLTAATTEGRAIEIGSGRSGNGNAFIDFIGDATYTDYGLRIIRGASGANTNSQIVNRGTGALSLYSVEAGSVDIYTNNTQRLVVRSDGNVGIGSAGGASSSLGVGKNITGATTSYGINTTATVQPDVTTQANYNYTGAFTASNGGTPYTISSLNHYNAAQGTFNADSTVSSQAGYSSAGSLIGGTNNYAFIANNTAAVTTGKTAYGFYSAVNTATGGGTTWGFYSGGTANNYFNGSVGIGTTTMTSKLNVNGDIYLPIASGIATPRASDNAFVRMLYMDTGTNTTVINGGYGSVSASSVGIAFKNSNGTTVGAIGAIGQIGVGGTGFGTSGQTIISAGSSSAPAWGTLGVTGGGTGATTLTGYVKGSGTSALTASATIPNTDITGLGTMSTQDANNVAITGGSITGITDLAVADGGTGSSSFTAYAVITGGTTSTGALQSVSGVGTSGQILTSNGASALPTWQDSPAGLTLIQTDTFDASGTYNVPTAADVFKVRMWGAGGSGGCGSSNAPAGGGGGGGFFEAFFTRMNLQANTTLSVTVGSGGAARTTQNTAGAAGGDTDVGGATGRFSRFKAYGGGGGGQAAAGGGGGGGGGSGNGSAGGTASGATAGTAGTGGATLSPTTYTGNNNTIVFTRVTYGTANDPTTVVSLDSANATNFGTRIATGSAGAAGNVNTGAGQDPSGNDLIDSAANSLYGGAGGGGGRDSAGSATANRGGNATYGGGGGGGAAQSTTGGNGGTSTYGGAGGAGSVDAAAAGNGVQPGGGGGGSEGGTSGAGGDGRVIIYAYRFSG